MVELGVNDTQTVVELNKSLSKKKMGVSTFPNLARGELQPPANDWFGRRND